MPKCSAAKIFQSMVSVFPNDFWLSRLYQRLVNAPCVMYYGLPGSSTLPTWLFAAIRLLSELNVEPTHNLKLRPQKLHQQMEALPDVWRHPEFVKAVRPLWHGAIFWSSTVLSSPLLLTTRIVSGCYFRSFGSAAEVYISSCDGVRFLFASCHLRSSMCPNMLLIVLIGFTTSRASFVTT